MSSSKTVTASTASRALEDLGAGLGGIDRPVGPFRRRTLASELSPTTRKSPRPAASRKQPHMAAWSRSKQPLVKTTVWPARRRRSTSAVRWSRSRTCEPRARWWSIRSRRISSRVKQRDAELLDLEAAGDVAQRGGLVVVGAAGQAEADDREDHVAGAGDVVDLPWPSRQELGPAVGADQRHAVAVERDQDGLHPQRLDQRLADPQGVFGLGDRHTGGQLGFETVGRHAVDAAIAASNRPSGSGRRAP